MGRSRARARTVLAGETRAEQLSNLSKEKLISMIEKLEFRDHFYSRDVRLKDRKQDTSNNERVLFISDFHAPYQHPDALDFLDNLNQKYKFDKIICMGDELDLVAWTNYKLEEGMYQTKAEEEKAGKAFLRQVEQIFPEVDLMKANHGENRYDSDLDYIDWIFVENGQRVGNCGKGWHYSGEETMSIVLNDGTGVFIAHQVSDDEKHFKERVRGKGRHIVQSHYHSRLEIKWITTPDGPRAFMTVGCLIDPTSPAFNYAKHMQFDAALGCGAFIDGNPVIFPMLTKNNRWTGKLT